ncbi:solute carrier family 23 protein [Streptomyces sp. NBC_01264]|uniref:solute carrier family 23 protein n=1 Tax=Streptomyces sp. NBC_01264 TaxID=2903804 RepID=UPI002B1E279A|nr:solute carrier family 23 protein [Streptomyces sp. NBC_01264]
MARVAAPLSATGKQSTHPVDEVLPLPKLALYGFQHVLAFYAGAVIVPIIVGGALGLSTEQLVYLINADLFTCGIASIIQAWGIGRVGARLPLIQGVTFTAVSPMIAIGLGAGGGTAGLLVIYGAVITAGIATFAFAWLPPQGLPHDHAALPAGRHRHGDHRPRHRADPGRPERRRGRPRQPRLR